MAEQKNFFINLLKLIFANIYQQRCAIAANIRHNRIQYANNLRVRELTLGLKFF